MGISHLPHVTTTSFNYLLPALFSFVVRDPQKASL